MTITDCFFTYNDAGFNPNFGGSGGGIAPQRQIGRIYPCGKHDHLQQCRSQRRRRYFQQCRHGTVNNCTISNNDAGSGGGGLSSITTNPSYQLEISNSTLSGNRATNAGGGIHANNQLTIRASTFSGNTSGYNNAGKGGGGCYQLHRHRGFRNVYQFYLRLQYCRIKRGEVYTTAGTADFINCTFSGNSTPNGAGGAIANDDDNKGVTNLKNTLVEGTYAGDLCSWYHQRSRRQPLQ